MGNELTKVEKYASLQKLEMCIEVFDTPLVRNLDTLELDKVILPAVLKANSDLGFNPNEEKLTHLFANISDEVKRSVPNIPLGEIPIAIQKGILGDYGDFQGLSVVTVIKFLKSHYASEKRAEIAKQSQVKEEEKPIPTLEEQKEIAKQHLIEGFSRYKETGKLAFSAVYLYRFLNEHFGLITYTPEIKWEMYYQAIDDVIHGKEAGILQDFNLRHRNKKAIDVLKSYKENFPDKTECAKQVFKTLDDTELRILVKNASEKLAIKRFFDDLIEMEADITELLTTD